MDLGSLDGQVVLQFAAIYGAVDVFRNQHDLREVVFFCPLSVVVLKEAEDYEVPYVLELVNVRQDHFRKAARYQDIRPVECICECTYLIVRLVDIFI